PVLCQGRSQVERNRRLARLLLRDQDRVAAVGLDWVDDVDGMPLRLRQVVRERLPACREEEAFTVLGLKSPLCFAPRSQTTELYRNEALVLLLRFRSRSVRLSAAGHETLQRQEEQGRCKGLWPQPF